MPKKILLVDDEEVIHRTVKRMLSGHYEVSGAYNGVEALEKVRQDHPDLVLLDINMPKKDGRQVIQELRQDPATEKIPVIMLTGNAQVMDKIAGFEMGADDYITKPFFIEELTSRIEKVFSKKAA